MADSNTSSNNTTLPALSSQIGKVEIPAEIRSRWQMIPAGKFDQERAVVCYALTTGAWEKIQPYSFADALTMQAPSLGGVAFYSGEKPAVQMVAEMITSASLLLNVGKNLRAEQVYHTARLLLNNPEYKVFTVADFRLALNRGVMGKYGQVFDKFDIHTISDWLNQYWTERLDEAERIADQRHSESKSTKGDGRKSVVIDGEKFTATSQPVRAIDQGVKSRWDIFGDQPNEHTQNGQIGWLAEWEDGRFAFWKVGMQGRVVLDAGAVTFDEVLPTWFSDFVREFTAKNESTAARAMPEFEPDALILDLWKSEWEAMPEADRPKFENYCRLQTLKFRR